MFVTHPLKFWRINGEKSFVCVGTNICVYDSHDSWLGYGLFLCSLADCANDSLNFVLDEKLYGVRCFFCSSPVGFGTCGNNFGLDICEFLYSIRLDWYASGLCSDYDN
jgi:hypothetical protein